MGRVFRFVQWAIVQILQKAALLAMWILRKMGVARVAGAGVGGSVGVGLGSGTGVVIGGTSIGFAGSLVLAPLHGWCRAHQPLV